MEHMFFVRNPQQKGYCHRYHLTNVSPSCQGVKKEQAIDRLSPNYYYFLVTRIIHETGSNRYPRLNDDDSGMH